MTIVAFSFNELQKKSAWVRHAVSRCGKITFIFLLFQRQRYIFLDSRNASNLVCFHCQHYFHDYCLQQARQVVSLKKHFELVNLIFLLIETFSFLFLFILFQASFCPICASSKSSTRKKALRQPIFFLQFLMRLAV